MTKRMSVRLFFSFAAVVVPATAQDFLATETKSQGGTTSVRIDATPEIIAFWSILRDLDDPRIEYEAIASDCANYLKNNSQSKHCYAVEKLLKEIRKMLREDRPQDNVESLIFDLRNQDGVCISAPSPPDLFARDWLTVLEKSKEPSAARALVNLGWAAVPTLLTHIDDQTPSRCVNYSRVYWTPESYLSVGDCVIEILRKIDPDTRTLGSDEVRARKVYLFREHFERVGKDMQNQGMHTESPS